VELLKQLKAAGERGRNIRGFNTRVALQRLARGGYVVARAGVELVNYRITKRGEDAIAENDCARDASLSMARRRLRAVAPDR
jgi:hypothetical protein